MSVPDMTKRLVKELFRHAQKDDCYECKQLLRAMGANPDKPLEEQLPQ